MKRSSRIICLLAVWLGMTLQPVRAGSLSQPTIGDSIVRQPSAADSIAQPSAGDTVSYELPAPRNFNALRFAMDSRHRYLGDGMAKGSTWLDFGGGVMWMNHGNTNRVEPLSQLHLRLGRQFSPLHAVRIGLTGGWGYLPNGTTGEEQEVLMAQYGAEADYLFGLSSYLLGYRPERILDVSALLGVGYNHFRLGGGKNRESAVGLKDKASSVNIHAGLQLKFFAGPRAALAAEPYVALNSYRGDLADQGQNWHQYQVTYGINLSCLYYLNNTLTPASQEGRFKKHFAQGRRWLQGDSHDKNQRRPLYLHYGVGAVAFNSFDGMDFGSTAGPSFSIGVGGWLSSALGLRLTANTANAQFSTAGKRTYYMNYGGASVDVVLNPFGFTRHYNWESAAGINLLGGYEFGMLKMENTPMDNLAFVMGYRLGVQPWVRLSHDMRFYVEPAYTVMNHRQGLQNKKQDRQFGVRMGLELLMGGREDEAIAGEGPLPVTGYFVGIGGGWNTTLRRWKTNSHEGGFLKNGQLVAGYHFNAYSTLMLSEEYLTERMTMGLSDEEQRRDTWMSAIDYQLNLSNVLTGYNPLRRWNVSLFAGPSLAFTDGKGYVGGNVGLQVDYRLSRHFLLYYQHRCYWMDKRMYPSRQVYTPGGTVINSLSAGVMYTFDDLVGPTTRLARGVAHGVATGASVFGRAVGQGAVAVGRTVGKGASAFGRAVGKGVSRGAKHMFVAVGGGWNFQLYSKLHYKGNAGNFNSLLMAGYEFSPLHTLRGQWEYVSEIISEKGYEDTRYGTHLFSLNYQLSVVSLLAGKSKDRRWDVGLVAGPSVTHKGDLGVNGGATAFFRLDSHWRMFFNYNVYAMSLLDRKSPFYSRRNYPKSTLLNTLTIGAAYHF